MNPSVVDCEQPLAMQRAFVRKMVKSGKKRWLYNGRTWIRTCRVSDDKGNLRNTAMSDEQ